MGIITTTNASRAIKDVIAERLSQVIDHNHAHEQDDEYLNGALANYAAVYALTPEFRKLAVNIPPRGIYAAEQCSAEYAFVPGGFAHPDLDLPRRDQLVRAAALLIAEIERIDREHVKWCNRPATAVNVGDEILFNGCRQVVNGLSVVDYGGSRLLFELSRTGPVHFYMSDYVTVAQH